MFLNCHWSEIEIRNVAFLGFVAVVVMTSFKANARLVSDLLSFSFAAPVAEALK